VTSTGPFPGAWRNKDGNYVDDPLGNRATVGNVTEDLKTQCPEGTYNAAFYHVHPDPSTFSGVSDGTGDVGWSWQTGIPITVTYPGSDSIEVGIPREGIFSIPLGNGSGSGQ